MSFPDIVLNYKSFLNKGYNKSFLIQSLHTMLVLPFFFALNDWPCFSLYNEYNEKI